MTFLMQFSNVSAWIYLLIAVDTGLGIVEVSRHFSFMFILLSKMADILIFVLFRILLRNPTKLI